MKPIVFFSSVLLLSSPVLADTSSDAETAAKALDSEAVRLRDSGKPPGDYCPKFAASETVAPTVVRKFAVAACLVAEGKMASAFAKYKEIWQIADETARNNPKDAVAVHQRAAAEGKMNDIEPKVSKLSITVTEKVAGLVVRRGNDPLPDAIVGIPMPIDAGTYQVTAKAPGFKTFSASVQITEPGTKTVNIPKLDPGCDTGAPGADGKCLDSSGTCGANQSLVAGKCECAQGFTIVNGACTASAVCSQNESLVAGKCECAASFTRNSSGVCQSARSSGGGGPPVWTWVFGGVGIASLATSGVFLGLSASKFNDAKNNGCDVATKTCDSSKPAGISMYNDAAMYANVSTVTFIAGGVLVLAGVGFWIFGGSGHDSAPKTSLVVTPGGLFLSGSF